MKQSKTELYVHFVWATYRRLPLVTAAIESSIYGCLLREAQHHGCEVIALGGIEDHVHLLMRYPAKHSLAFLIQRIKGGSSAFVRERILPGEFFGWQDGYGAFSVTPSHIAKVADYVKNQKTHHANGNLHDAWEESEEDYEGAVTSQS